MNGPTSPTAVADSKGEGSFLISLTFWDGKLPEAGLGLRLLASGRKHVTKTKPAPRPIVEPRVSFRFAARGFWLPPLPRNRGAVLRGRRRDPARS